LKGHDPTKTTASEDRSEERARTGASRSRDITEVPDAATLKAFNAKITEEFRANDGKVGGPFEGNELLLLTTTGAKSGEPRLSPLSCKRIAGKLFIIAGNGGADVNPSWVYNLRANPRAHVELGTESFDVTARELLPAERADIVPKLTADVSAFAEYQAKTSRVIPIFELEPVEQ
jgi:deazaflavin-dependent oxidoreductase (nitroreductase family)